MIKIILECEHKDISECKDCPVSVFNKLNKAIEFIKEAAKAEEYINSMCAKYLIPHVHNEISMKATELLKELDKD